MGRGGRVDPPDRNVTLECDGQKEDRNRYRDALIGDPAARDDRLLIKNKLAAVVIAVLDFRTGGLVLVPSPMLVHDRGRMFAPFMIGVEMNTQVDMDWRQQQSANQCARCENRNGTADPG